MAVDGTISFDFMKAATAIWRVQEAEADHAPWYDLQGRRVSAPTRPGIYIRNGKKFIVK
jgi:hypothetical protein